MREEKIEQQRIHQEERLKKALERAQAEAVKKVKIFKCFQVLLVGLQYI